MFCSCVNVFIKGKCQAFHFLENKVFSTKKYPNIKKKECFLKYFVFNKYHKLLHATFSLSIEIIYIICEMARIKGIYLRIEQQIFYLSIFELFSILVIFETYASHKSLHKTCSLIKSEMRIFGERKKLLVRPWMVLKWKRGNAEKVENKWIK